jgi:hypothetical protein
MQMQVVHLSRKSTTSPIPEECNQQQEELQSKKMILQSRSPHIHVRFPWPFNKRYLVRGIDPMNECQFGEVTFGGRDTQRDALVPYQR